MSKKRLLITGGAGFIGSHLADELLAHGYEVRVLDNLTRRVHGSGARPHYLSPDVELLVGDVRDGAVVEQALEGVDAVFHLAAAVGAGESVFEADRCLSANNVGTAVLMDRLVRSPVERLILASSGSVYGEGLYRDATGAAVVVDERTPEQLHRGEWEPSQGGAPLVAAPTPEGKAPAAASVYARSKHDQERMCLRMGRAFGLPTIALRFFNVFGPRQTSSCPYTGDLALMAARLLQGRRPAVMEDGLQTRDLIDVRDVATACRLALESPAPNAGTVNVASGRARTMRDLARTLAHLVGRPDLAPEVTGKGRLGDVRHCFGDVGRAKRLFGFEAETDLDARLADLVRWIAEERPTSILPGVRRARWSAPPVPMKDVHFGLGVAS